MRNFFKSPNSFSTFWLEEKVVIFDNDRNLKLLRKFQFSGWERKSMREHKGLEYFCGCPLRPKIMFVALLYLTFAPLLQVMCSAREL